MALTSKKNIELGLMKTKEVIMAEAKLYVAAYARNPIVLSHGKGSKLYDVEGNEYLDMSAGLAVNCLGHGDEDWIRAIQNQANTLTHVSNYYYTIPQLELARRLVESSFADRVFFTSSGTEANEAAIKFARRFQRSTHPNSSSPPYKFIAFHNSFHGRAMGTLALTSKDRSAFEPVMSGVTFLDYGDAKAARELILSGGIAGVFVEPIQGEGGIHSASKEFLQELRSACDETGALLIYDEVQCGLGRSGYLWAHQRYEIYPDIMTLAKPLGGGLPIGAVLVTERIAETVKQGDHGGTFGGGPLVCSASLVVLDKISKPEFLKSVSKKGKYFKDLLNKMVGDNRHVREVRGQGLIMGMEFNIPASVIVDAFRTNGLLVATTLKRNVIRLIPPLIISEEELEKAAGIIAKCLNALDAGNGKS